MIQLEATKGRSQGMRAYNPEGISPRIKSSGGDGSAKTPMIQTIPHGWNDGIIKPLPSLGSDLGSDRNELLVYPGVANAVTDGYLMDAKPHAHPMNQYRIRRLTPIECERLQGFPDGWTAGASDTQRYKMMGNAVTVNVIEAIGRRILETEATEPSSASSDAAASEGSR